jgi:DNA-binding response OmpR family regulator
MRVLVADDEPIPRLLLERALAEWGHEVVAVADGAEAWQALRAADGPKLAVLDWVMPGIDGTEICRRLRAEPATEPVYVLLLTARGAKADVVAGLQAGANDYVTKPFDREELRARVEVGRAVVELQASLAARVRELEQALAQVKQLRGLLPICCYCKKVRDDRDYWQQVEEYVTARSEARFSHGICPDCVRNVVEPQLRSAGLRK